MVTLPANGGVAARGNPLPEETDDRAAILVERVLVLETNVMSVHMPLVMTTAPPPNSGNDRAPIGILDIFPQPERHFLKTTRVKA
jgi:hypothetical protein